MNNNQNHQKPKKKYSGALFLENDEFNCFVDSHGNKIQKPNAKSFQQGEMSQEQAGGVQTEQNILNSIGGYNNQYYNMYNNNPMFPMVQVPMNMPLLNMMNFGNMLYNMNNEQSNFDTSFNHFMNLPVEEIMAGFEETVLDQKAVNNSKPELKMMEANLSCSKQSSRKWWKISENMPKINSPITSARKSSNFAPKTNLKRLSKESCQRSSRLVKPTTELESFRR